MSPEAIELVQRILVQEESALLELYEQFGGLVYSIAVRVLNDPVLAEEVTQDVFMKVWEKAQQFDAAQASFTTWLSRIARNSAIDALRKRQNRQPEKGSFSIDENPYAFEQTLAATYAEDPTQKLLVKGALNEIPSEQAELIYMAYFSGMTHNDIAATTGLPLGTVKSRIRAGMQKLREVLISNPIGEENT